MSDIVALFDGGVSERTLVRGYRALGRLAAWWLRKDVLDRIAPDESALADVRAGEFVVLLARDGESNVVHDGLALPLCWKRGKRPDQRLPPALASLAQEIMRKTANANGASWQLWLGEGCPDLSECVLGVQSASAMLTATLHIAAMDAQLDATVSATAVCADGADLQPIDGLAAKLDAARRVGLKRVCVSRLQHEIPLEPAVPIVQLEGRDLNAQVQQLVLQLDAPPTKGSLDARCEWYQRHSQPDRARSFEFYCSSLASELAARARVRAEPPQRAHSHLALITTGNAEIAAFSASYYECNHVIVFFQRGGIGETYADKTTRAIRCARPSACVTGIAWSEGQLQLMIDDACAQLRAVVEDSRGSNSSLVVDLTGGTTLMKFALFHAARQLALPCSVIDTPHHAQGGLDVQSYRVVVFPQ